MEKYIEGNKEAWEEAFDLRQTSWGTDIVTRVQSEILHSHILNMNGLETME